MPADLILRNARVRSGPEYRHLQLASVAVGEGRIMAVGANAADWGGPATTVIDLDGALVAPGFIDCHTHLGWAGEGMWRVNWTDAEVCNRANALQRVRIAANRIEPGLWLLGGDWSRTSLPDAELPSLMELDAATGAIPTFLCSQDRSLALTNSRALALFSGGERFGDGRLYGADAHARGTEGVIPPADRFRRRAELRAAVRELVRHGVTEAHDIATLPDPGPTLIHRERSFTDASLFAELAERNELPVRIGIRPYLGRWADVAAYRAPDPLITCLGVKELIDDGRYSAAGADFGYEFRYPGAPTALEWMRNADRAGLSVTLHALGDLAVREALDLFEEIARSEPERPRRPRLSHARRIAATDLERIARLDVTVEAQPWDIGAALPRLARFADADFLELAFPFRSLKDAGARLVFSSDWRISPQRPDLTDMDPLIGMYVAVSRQSPLGGPIWQPQQRLSVGEALEAYTSSAARVAGAASQRSAVQPGMQADLVVLSRDIVAEQAEALLDTRVLMTIMDGKVRYSTVG